MPHLTSWRVSLSLFLIGSLSATYAQASNVADLDQAIRDAMTLWKAPGLAVVVVQDDRIVYLRGFGVRELGKSDVVTPDTIFPLASCTKTFTSLALGMLADDGKLTWDDAPRKHLPWFQLADPLIDRSVTLRDLLSHRTGVASHDALWYRTPWSIRERIEKTAKIRPTLAFRQDFQYQTVLFSAAGEAGAAAAQKPWRTVIEERIFDPLDMKASRCTGPPVSESNVAKPHRRGVDGKIEPIKPYDLSQPDPAGSIHSTARDLAKFLRFQLSDGTSNGKRLISVQNLTEPHSPQICLRMEGAVKTLNPETLFLNYGLGWIVQDYRGKLIVMHGGTIDGFRAHFTLVPRERLGIALLNNLDRNLLNLALSHHLVDHFLDLPAKAWPSYFFKIQQEEYRLAREQAELAQKARKAAPPPLRPFEQYVGLYADDVYGPCEIHVKKGRLVFTWAKLETTLDPLGADTFLGNDPPLRDNLFTFEGERAMPAQALRIMDRRFHRIKHPIPPKSPVP